MKATNSMGLKKKQQPPNQSSFKQIHKKYISIASYVSLLNPERKNWYSFSSDWHGCLNIKRRQFSTCDSFIPAGDRCLAYIVQMATSSF